MALSFSTVAATSSGKQPLISCTSTIGRFVLYSFLVWIVCVVLSVSFMTLYFIGQYLVSALISSQPLPSSVSLARFATCGVKSMSKETPYSVSFVTINEEQKAIDLATKIVESQLAACVNIIPKVQSIYSWKGKIERDSELILMIKSRQSKLSQLTDFIRLNHPYEVCEVISLPIQHGNQPYLDWIGAQVPDESKESEKPAS